MAKSRLIIFLGIVVLIVVAVWHLRSVRKDAIALSTTLPPGGINADSSVMAPGGAAGERSTVAPRGLPWLPSTPHADKKASMQALQRARRSYYDLSRMRNLGEIQDVGAAMKLPRALVDKLIRWNDVRFAEVKEIDSVQLETAEQEKRIQGNIVLLGLAYEKALERLLADQYDRYEKLLQAHRGGRFEQEVRGEKSRGETITIKDRMSGPVDTKAYDPLFQ